MLGQKAICDLPRGARKQVAVFPAARADFFNAAARGAHL